MDNKERDETEHHALRSGRSVYAKRSLTHGAKFPYDAPDAWWRRSHVAPPSARDWAEAAARGVIADLQDRAGIKHGFDDVAEETRIEIVQALSDIIRTAASDPRWQEHQS